ncbi:hypothetical protein Bhyg_04351 [Pseudolycoriella hygida]|uniref:Uncharacterized protein n=1 Tax=Pseudolycoriella hygida TaxID=35572 RepID=A0A9Q0S9I8_9DIPT|nr:hypothetical protein Bhyg_04351 [Pseudolycoriella hygida]
MRTGWKHLRTNDHAKSHVVSPGMYFKPGTNEAESTISKAPSLSLIKRCKTASFSTGFNEQTPLPYSVVLLVENPLGRKQDEVSYHRNDKPEQTTSHKTRSNFTSSFCPSEFVIKKLETEINNFESPQRCDSRQKQISHSSTKQNHNRSKNTSLRTSILTLLLAAKILGKPKSIYKSVGSNEKHVLPLQRSS